MGAAFIVLTLVMFCAALMSGIFNSEEMAQLSSQTFRLSKTSDVDDELAAVIASAAAAILNATGGGIEVHNIKKA